MWNLDAKNNVVSSSGLQHKSDLEELIQQGGLSFQQLVQNRKDQFNNKLGMIHNCIPLTQLVCRRIHSGSLQSDHSIPEHQPGRSNIKQTKTKINNLINMLMPM